MLTKKEKFISILSNSILRKSDAIILLEGDGVHRVKKACNLYNTNYAPNLVFSGNAYNLSYGSYPFNKEVKNEFKKYNVDPNIVIHENKSLHTKQQAKEVIQLAIERNWSELILVASNFHQYRAFLIFVEQLYNSGLEKSLKIYNTPSNLPWFKKLDWGTRDKFLENEFTKIEQYQNGLEYCLYDRGLKYLEWVEKN
jgi:uncharacterized SAM-binding protein YcdF (DUF218 family)